MTVVRIAGDQNERECVNASAKKAIWDDMVGGPLLYPHKRDSTPAERELTRVSACSPTIGQHSALPPIS
jgi:hypothetical protein